MIGAALRMERSDMDILEISLKEETAKNTDEQIEIYHILNRKQLLGFLAERNLTDIICVDVSKLQGVKDAERLRGSYPKAVIVALADMDTSPLTYMKPGILAASLLIKPLNRRDADAVFRELFLRFLIKTEDEEIFLVETREEKQRIPYAQILYFEARAKKIYACLKDCEYGFYDTMDHLEESLSSDFIRCHRSYLVNYKWIEQIRLSQNCLYLQWNIMLPISRSYKGRMKELMK